jgi:hypothetical protein
VVGDHCVEKRGRVLPDHRDRRVDVARRDRVALLRHGAARAAARRERLVDLADLGLHHQFHVHRQLAERSADQAEEASDFGDAVSSGMPGDRRLPETQLGHDFGLHLESAVLDRRQRAAGAAEFADQHARPQLGEPLPVPVHGGEDRGHLVAEGHGNGLLQVAAPGDGRIPVAARKLSEPLHDRIEIGLHQLQRFANLQHRRGVGNVLSRRAPVAVLAEAIAAQFIELGDDAEHRISDPLGLGTKLVHVDLRDVAVASDLGCGFAGNDSPPTLNLGERLLDQKVLGGPAFVRPHLAHRFGAEDSPEDVRVDDRCGHAAISLRCSARARKRSSSLPKR